MKITVQTTVSAPIEKVWKCWTNLTDINGWAFASSDWEADAQENNLQVGGNFKTVMSAKDKTASFDFIGMYTEISEYEKIAYDMEDGRHVDIVFEAKPQGVTITETFEAEKENSEDVQRDGWQAILDNFKKYIES